MIIALCIVGYILVAIISGRIHNHFDLLEYYDGPYDEGIVTIAWGLGVILWPIGLMAWFGILIGWLFYKGITTPIKVSKLSKYKIPDLEFIKQAEKELAMGDYSEEAKIAKINALKEEIRLLEREF